MFTKEEYVDWRSNKVTKTLVKLLAENRQGRLDAIGDGKGGEGASLHEAIGQTQGIKDSVEFLLNMNGELNDLIIIEEQTNDA